MTKEEFYVQIAVDPFNFKLREELLVHFQYDRVFVNGQKWQIENKKYPAFNGDSWFLYNVDYEIYSCLTNGVFDKLVSTSFKRHDGLKYKQYRSLSEAEADLAQAIEKIRRPFILIQLTATGFELI